MAVLPAVVLTAAELEDDDLLLAVLRDDLRLDLGPRDERRADLERFAADQEHLIEGHGLADVRRELLDPQPVALGDFVLLPARLDYRVHGTGPLRLPPPCSVEHQDGGGGSRGQSAISHPA